MANPNGQDRGGQIDSTPGYGRDSGTVPDAHHAYAQDRKLAPPLPGSLDRSKQPIAINQIPPIRFSRPAGNALPVNVFLSYKVDDNAQDVEALAKEMSGVAGGESHLHVFSSSAMPWGKDWKQEIVDELKKADW